MTTIDVRADLVDQLQHLADTRHQSLDEVVEKLLTSKDEPNASTATLETILSSAWQLFTLVDADGYITEANEIAKDVGESILGRRMAVGNSVYDFVFDGDVASFKTHFQQVLAGETITVEKNFSGANKVHCLRMRYAPIKSPTGAVLGVCLSSENKEFEVALHNAEEQFRQLAEHLPIAFFLTDPQKKQTIYISPAYEQLTGMPLERFYKNPRSFLEIVYHEDHHLVEAALRQQILGENVNVEYRILHPEKGLRWIKSQAFPVVNEVGEVYRIAGIAQDITELKETEIALRESQQRYAQAEELGHFGHWERDLVADTAYWSPEIYRILGLDPHDEALNFEGILGFIHPDDLPQFTERVETALQTASEITAEYRVVRPDGEERIIYSVGHVRHDKDGQPTQFIGTLTDITERRHTESQLRLYEIVVEAASELIISMNLSYKFVLVNRTYLEYHQLRREDIIGHHIAELLGEEFFTHVIKPRFMRCLTGEVQHFEADFEYPEKGKRHLLVTYSPMRDSSGHINGVVTIMRDITERKQAQIALQESEQKLETLFKVLPVGVSLLDNNNQIVQINPALENILDLTLPELLRGNYHNRRYIQSDGSPMLPDQFPSVRANTEQRAILDVEIGVVKEDESIIWTSVSAAPLPNPDIRVVVVTSNISERKQNEVDKLALALERERAIILRDFVTYSTHEFRTPLSIMRTSIFLAQHAANEEDRNKKLERVEEQIMVVQQLVENLIMITELESNMEYVTHTCDLNLILRDDVFTAKKNHAPDVKIQLQLDSKLPMIEGNASDLIRAFIEIINNAIQFTPSGGTITIQTAVQHQQVIVTVQDTGIGMSPDVLSHIFERFYRFDKAHTTRGLGLGLPIAKKIMELHHGNIQVKTEPDKGTVVTVTLLLIQS